MRFDDERSGLYLIIKDDLRQRDVTAWARGFREWKDANQVGQVDNGKLSTAEYNAGALYAAIKAGWIVASGRLETDQPIVVDALPTDAAQIDDLPPALVKAYGTWVVIAYGQVTLLSPKANLPPPIGLKAEVASQTN